MQQTDVEAVIGSGLSTSDRVVTTGFANLAEGSRVIVGRDEGAPTPDLAPRRRQGQGQGQGKGRRWSGRRRTKGTGWRAGQRTSTAGAARGGRCAVEVSQFNKAQVR